MAMVFLIIFSLILSVSAQQNITLNSPLLAIDRSSPWLSPSGDFAFGFRRVSNTDDQAFLLAIWFDKIPDKTIVWYANGDNPAPEGSRVQITENGLALTGPNGQLIWNQSQVASVSYGSMLDTGNFVLVDNSNVINNVLWESFKDPRDTILPSQTLESSNMLFSRFSETNFSRGRFKLFFSDDDGGSNLQLGPVDWPARLEYESYYRSDNGSGSINQLVFNGSTNIYLKDTNGKSIMLRWTIGNIPDVSTNYYYRATLDYSGGFTVYAYPTDDTSNQRWSIVQYLPEDVCSAITISLGSGSCGYNSYCTMVDGRPTCTCPPGYSFFDENNKFGGCRPNFPRQCGVDDDDDDFTSLEDLYEFHELQNVNWPMGDYEGLPNYTKADCAASCLKDCFCDIAIFGRSTTCWKKRIPVSNGRIESSSWSMALIRVRKGATTTSPHRPTPCISKGNTDSIRAAGLGASLVLNALLLTTVPLVLFLFCNRKSKKTGRGLPLVETNLLVLSYKEVEKTTDNFREEIGRGSSSVVYKGSLIKIGLNKMIAVKKLDKLAQEAIKEFKTEMEVIGKTCHKNLVRLLGFCDEAPHCVLVYPFMINGTLTSFLLRDPKPAWNVRAKIALEIARGLAYLHEECEVPIIHCDIKPENVLLDECYTAKISDFGLAKLLQFNQSRTLTCIRGTRGYVAPEWFRSSPITTKVDVYSFGVMLLEIIYCRKNVPKVEEEGEEILIDLVYDCFIEGKIGTLGETDEEKEDKERISKWAVISIWCTLEDPSNRPSMKMVVGMMEGFMDVPVPPVPLLSSNYYREDAV